MIYAIKKYFEALVVFLDEHKSKVFFAAKILIAAGLLIFIFNYVDINEILTAVSNANYTILFAAFALSFINVGLQYYKWKITCEHLLNETNDKKIFSSLFYGFAAGSFTPARVGEYFGRAIVFKNKSLLEVTVATLIDKLFPLLMVASLGTISSILFLHFYYQVSFYITVSLFIVFFTCLYFIVMLFVNPKFWENILFKKLKSSAHLNNLFERLRPLQSLNKKYSLQMTLISLLFYSCFILQYSLLVISFSGNTNVLNYLWAGNLIMFAKTIIPPVSFAELGIREGASVFFLTYFGETQAVAFNASIFLFMINVLLPSLVGLIFFFRKND